MRHARATSLAPAPEGSSGTAYAANGEAGAEELRFGGTFAGASGEYACSGSACTATLDNRGAVAALTGTWTFAPAESAMLQFPDAQYLFFGNWIREKGEDAFDFQSFAGATGYEASIPVTDAMTGSATYEGAAAGLYVLKDIAQGEVTSARDGRFTATATLEAEFFGAEDAGVVRGRVEDFRDADGNPLEGWSLTLGITALRASEAAFTGETGASLGSGALGTGHWQGRLYGGGDSDAPPEAVVGRFDAQFLGAHITGAYGASR